jgi:uncharacterized membrane protein
LAKEFERRFWEIDFLRGVAILMMILFHLLFDLDYFGVYTFNVHSGFWRYFAHATATIFLLLVGISLTLSFSRATKMGRTGKSLYRKYLKRGLKIFAWGITITIITWFLLKDGVVVWGILHLIGISIILAYPVIKFRYENLVLGLSIISIGLFLKQVSATFPWLLWLGVRPEHFYTLDYFPLIPWFGVVLIGVFLGNSLYTNYTRNFALHDFSELSPVQFLGFLGRHSLVIYLIHQPLLVTVLYLLDLVAIMGMV